MKTVTIEGLIASHDKKPYRGVIAIDEKTGLITNVSKPRKNKKSDYIFNNDCLIFPGFGDVHIHARKEFEKILIANGITPKKKEDIEHAPLA